MHQCSVCSKSFPSASKLERHHFTHTGQKPFTCSTCGKGFRQSVHLKKHGETHTGKNNPWSFPSDCLPHSSFTNAIEPLPTNQASPEKLEHGFNIYNTLTTPHSRLMFPQLEETKERLPLQTGVSHTEITHPPELMSPLVDNSFISQENILPNGQFLPNPVFPDNILGSGQASAGFWPADQQQTDKRYSCTICLKSFNSSYHLQRHMPTHSQLKPFECDMCGKAFKQKTHLKAHSQLHHNAVASEDRPAVESEHHGKMRVNHQCPTCLKTFCSPSKLKRHFMIHTGQKPYSCGDCGKAFRQVWHLKTHLYAHRCAGTVTDVKSERSQSVNCASASQSSDDLMFSNQGDHASVPVEVELQSEVRVSTPPDLNQLETTSQNQTAVKVEQQAYYQCSICSKTFSSLSKHRQHCMTHKELGPFQCHICNRTFRLAIHLKRHQISHKNQEDGFKNQNLMENLGDPLQDSVNPHQHPDGRMSSHLNGNVNPENMMPTSNIDQDSPTQRAEPTMISDQQISSDLDNSQNQKSRHKPHQCPTCFKSFPSPSKLQRHMMTHTGQRPFGCETCGKRFRQLSHLRIHSRTHLWTKYYKQRLPHTTRPHSDIIEHDTHIPLDAPWQEQVPQKQSGPDSSTEGQFGQPSAIANGWSENTKKRGFQRSTPSPFRAQRKAFASTRQRHNCGDCGKWFAQVPQLKVHSCSNPGLQNKIGLDCGTVPPQPTPSNQVDFLKSNTHSETPGEKCKATNPAVNTSYTRHQCLICCKYFPSFSKLERHSRVHTGLRPYQCLSCGKTFRQASHLTVHERTHNKFGPLRPTSQKETADNMKKQRQQPLYPKIHVQVPQTSSIKSDPRPSKNTKECDILQCKYEDKFSNQENTHHENKAVEMNEKSTKSKTNKLTNPRVKTKGEVTAKRRGHVCSVCQKGFDTPSKLSRHFLIHTGARPFKCSFCMKAFRQVWHRRNHERTHGIRGFIDAEQDSKVMGSPKTYPSEHHGSETISSAHMNGSETDMHTRDDPRPCSISPDPCLITEEAASHPIETRDHKCVDFHSLPDQGMDYENKTRELYQCPECHSVYPTPSELASHLEVHWRVSSQDLAGPSSSLPGSSTHSSTHSMSMAFPTGRVLAQADSHKGFSERHRGSGTESSGREDPLQAEMHYSDWNKPPQSFQCNKCLRSFETERVLQLHKCVSQAQVTHSNQYQCAICFKNFVSPSKLKRHYVTHTGQRPYECEVCVKTFTQLSHLKTHRHRAHVAAVAQEVERV